MEKMLDAGFCLPAIGFAFRRGGRGYWIFKDNYLFFIQDPVSETLWNKRLFLKFVFLVPACWG
jgi:hypothetical protein